MYKLKFGIHRSKSIKQIPFNYLKWLTGYKWNNEKKKLMFDNETLDNEIKFILYLDEGKELREEAGAEWHEYGDSDNVDYEKIKLLLTFHIENPAKWTELERKWEYFKTSSYSWWNLKKIAYCFPEIYQRAIEEMERRKRCWECGEEIRYQTKMDFDKIFMHTKCWLEKINKVESD